ncbi:ABC transporter substrate-binding protein [Gordonia rubripertincta]|uniref:ABC transporter substrate-binding protein n=1 Tax=Gordonia rubripertincta TaxID=36822 RepID=A0ABT4MQF1_GORRU|nr:ABC transporter substrate-binding protein [Gordonia rubripertincta]MCZ4549225.1 ABC transporter substrate-binding protein [Gordonia rubripertincta]
MLIVLTAALVLVAGCSGRTASEGEEDQGGGSASPTSDIASGFGDIPVACQGGSMSTEPTQGVSADEIRVGVFSDVGFNKNSEFVDAAEVFTSWCNDLGGINGRKVVANIRDSKLTETRKQMMAACGEDFALVGGGSALDGLGVKERVNCLLPSLPAQVAQLTSAGSDLEISADPSQVPGYDPFFGFRQWLMTDAYPESAKAVGIINGDSPVTKILGEQAVESTEAAGGTFVYNDLYPAMGVSDWTPYAQTMKSKGVKGLIFYGEFGQLAKLESVLTGMDYKLDWIDANNNAYGQQFAELAGTSAGYQHNYVDLGGNLPLSSGAAPMKQLTTLWEKYAPGKQLTLPAVRAMSAWLLFATSAAACGDDLTRTCLYDTAKAQSAWTGGGLHAPVNLTQPTPPSGCFNVEQLTPEGWVKADFMPDNGPFRCNVPAYKYTKDYGKPLTLADVGKSMNDVK